MNPPPRQPVESRAFKPNGALIWGLTISQMMGWGALYHCFPVYMIPMQKELGWSVTELNLALTIGLITADIVAVPVGHWIDTRGGRGLMTLGAAFGAALLGLWSQVNDLFFFYVIWALMGLVLATSLGNTQSAVVTANVRDFRRGLAYLSFFSSLASTIAIPLASVLLVNVGWRQGLMIQAVMQFCGPALINFFVLRGTRGSMMGEAARKRDAGQPSPVPQAMRRKAFWLLAIACSIHWFTSMAVSIHILPLMMERGLSMETAVSMIALNGPAAVIGRLAMFYLVPGNSGLLTGKIAFPVFALGAFILAMASGEHPWTFVVYSFTFGMAAGVLMIVRQTSVAEIFGVRGYGAITGALATVAIVPRTASPVAVAWLRDQYGAYDNVIWILFALTVIGTVAFYLAAAERNRER